jgi:hypothetical protein
LSLAVGVNNICIDLFAHQRDDDLAVTAGGEGVLGPKLLPDLLMVVDLSISLLIPNKKRRKCQLKSLFLHSILSFDRLMSLTTTTTVRSSLKSGWSPDSGETTASRCCARKLPSCWYRPDQSGPLCFSLHTPPHGWRRHRSEFRNRHKQPARSDLPIFYDSLLLLCVRPPSNGTKTRT